MSENRVAMLDKTFSPPRDRVREAVDGAPGYWAGPLLSDAELTHIRELIDRAFSRRLEELAPQHLAVFADAGIQRYHLHSHLIDHAAAWPRRARLFPSDAIEFLLQSSMLRRLADAFGPIEITNEIGHAEPEIVWRLVRPAAEGDIGPLHVDRWFWDINQWPIAAGRRLIKVWTMVHGETGRGGLRVVAGSHREEPVKYSVEHRGGIQKPVFDEIEAGVKPALVDTPGGTSVVFHYDLLHGGAATRGDVCRVSFEFTMSIPDC
jgi:hypothetical protein